jgi:hypothetical protein
MPIINATISDEEKIRIKQYLLGQLAEADEESLEQRLMSDPAFSEEFDIVVDEIATLYVSRHFTGEEKTQVEQYFLRSPERRNRVQFICELLRQLGEDAANQSEVTPVNVSDQRPTVWQRVKASWAQPSVRRPAMTFATLLIVGGLVFWVISLNSNPTYQPVELAMTSSERSTGTEKTRVRLESGVDGLRLKLGLPSPRAPQYRVALRGEQMSLRDLTIEAQDATSITVVVPVKLSKGSYAVQISEINDGRETPVRGAYEFEVD